MSVEDKKQEYGIEDETKNELKYDEELINDVVDFCYICLDETVRHKLREKNPELVKYLEDKYENKENRNSVFNTKIYLMRMEKFFICKENPKKVKPLPWDVITVDEKGVKRWVNLHYCLNLRPDNREKLDTSKLEEIIEFYNENKNVPLAYNLAHYILTHYILANDNKDNKEKEEFALQLYESCSEFLHKNDIYEDVQFTDLYGGCIDCGDGCGRPNYPLLFSVTYTKHLLQKIKDLENELEIERNYNPFGLGAKECQENFINNINKNVC